MSCCWWLLLLISMIHGTYQTSSTRIVFVDALAGTANTQCKKHTKQTCKTLKSALRKAEEYDIIHILGNQILSESVSITKSISITTARSSKGRIIGSGRVKFAFVLKNHTLKLKLSNIRFENISILDSTYNASVSVCNIYSTGSRSRALFRVRESHFHFFLMNSTFSETKYVIRMDNHHTNLSFVVKITNCKFKTTNGFYIRSISMKSSVIVRSCSFDSFDLRKFKFFGLVHIAGSYAVQIASCNFSRQLSGYKASGHFLRLAKTTNVSISYCNFYRGNIYLWIVSASVIQYSRFEECQSERSGGAISVINSRKMAIISECYFERNRAIKTGGAIFLNQHKIKKFNHLNPDPVLIKNCKFLNNEARSSGQSIHSCIKVRLENISVNAMEERSTAHLQLGGGSVTLANVNVKSRNIGKIRSSLVRRGITVISHDIKVIGDIAYACPEHFNLRSYHTYYLVRIGYLDAVYTAFGATCESCRRGTYTLGTGKMTVYPYLKNVSRPTMLKKGKWSQSVTVQKCLQCPPGAKCDGSIIPLDNYWGFPLNGSSQLQFTQCPSGYCCSAQSTPCTSYNTCANGRSGRLCGSCAPGYDLSFVKDKCVSREGECNVRIFITYFIITSLMYTIIFTFLPCVIDFFKEMHSWLGTNRGRERPKTKSINRLKQGQQEKHLLRVSEKVEEHQPFSLSAYMITICFFFQVVSLIHVTIPSSAGESGKAHTEFQRVMFSFFNVRFNIYQKICPIDGLTLPTKELLTIVLKLSSIFNLMLFYVCWRLFLFLKKVLTPDDRPDVEFEIVKTSDVCVLQDLTKSSERFKWQGKLSFASILKIGLLKLVKLNLTSISTFAFQMLHCVEIDKKMYLYLYGDHECYVHWQFMILFSVLPVILLFPAAFGFSLNLLKEGLVSSNSFLIASICPYYALWLYAQRKTIGLQKHHPNEEEQKCINFILEMEEGLFKSAESGLRWPVVQLYRNFLVAVLNTFILTPMYRMMAFIPVFLAFSSHDRHRMPYKHQYLNYLQWLSSSCLLVIVTCNIPASMSVMMDSMSLPGMGIIILALQYVEMLIYAIMPCSLPAWKLWEKYIAYQDSRKKVS